MAGAGALLLVMSLASSGPAQAPPTAAAASRLRVRLPDQGRPRHRRPQLVDAVRDVGIKDGKVAAVAADDRAAEALKTVDASGPASSPPA